MEGVVERYQVNVVDNFGYLAFEYSMQRMFLLFLRETVCTNKTMWSTTTRHYTYATKKGTEEYTYLIKYN